MCPQPFEMGGIQGGVGGGGGGGGGGGQWVGAAGLCHLHTVMPCVMLRLCHIEHAEQAVQFLIMTVAKRHHR